MYIYTKKKKKKRQFIIMELHGNFRLYMLINLISFVHEAKSLFQNLRSVLLPNIYFTKCDIVYGNSVPGSR